MRSEKPTSTQTPAALIFDLDGTLIRGNVIWPIFGSFWGAGLLKTRHVARGLPAFVRWVLTKEAPGATERFAAAIMRSIRGWSVAATEAAIADAATRLVGRIYPEMRALIEQGRAEGKKVYIFSASAGPFIRPVAEALRVDGYWGSTLAVADGVFTGEVDLLQHQAKADLIQRLAEDGLFDPTRSAAYSDSLKDLPLLRSVAEGFLVKNGRVIEGAYSAPK